MTSFRKDILTEDPNVYARQALSRCTSGVQAGCLRHDILLEFLHCLQDVIPQVWVTRLAAGMASKAVQTRKKKYGDKF